MGKKGVVTRNVLARKMTREHYLKRYAKDAEGNYAGTEQPAIDAGLVFVPGKGTDEELIKQVKKVAFGTEHSNQYHVVCIWVRMHVRTALIICLERVGGYAGRWRGFLSKVPSEPVFSSSW
jgi:hypothetical protein